MKPRFSTRLPLLELSILLVLVAMGFALWQLLPILGRETASENTFDRSVDQFNTALEKNLDRVEAAFEKGLNDKEQHFHELLTAQEQRWRLAWQKHILVQSNLIKNFIEMEDSHKLRAAYLGLADRLESDLPEIHQALVQYCNQTNAADWDRHERKAQELSEWLRAHRLRLESEGVIARSQQLAADESNPLSMDLAATCQTVQNGLSGRRRTATSTPSPGNSRRCGRRFFLSKP